MSLSLRPLSNDEFEAWFALRRDSYAEDMVKDAGIAPEKATAMAATQMDALFPGRVPSPEQLIYVLEEDGEPVGELWVCDRNDPVQHALFIYFVGIDEEHRGKGYGRAAMELAESEALLDEVWHWATRDELTWYNQWRVGDLVLCDNRCTMHRTQMKGEARPVA